MDIQIEIRDMRSGGFFMVHNSLLDGYGEKIGPFGIALYCALCRFASRDQQAYPSYQKLAALTGMSVRSVGNYLQSLENEKLVLIERRKEGDQHISNLYTLIDIHVEGGGAFNAPPQQQVQGGGAAGAPGVVQQVLTNNTQLNNTKNVGAVSQPPDDVTEDFQPADDGAFIKDTETTKFDLRCAEELNKAVTKNCKHNHQSDLRSWAAHFKQLRVRGNIEKDRIKEVLKWYVESDWTNEFAIQAYSGKSFREKFDAIQNQMERESKKKEELGLVQPKDTSLEIESTSFTREEALAFYSELDRNDVALSEEEYEEYKDEWERENKEVYTPPGYESWLAAQEKVSHED